MNILSSKEHVISELKKAGINICLTRTVGYNAFSLVYESYGFFCVNAIDGTSFEATQNFQKLYSNINILIGN
jgi:hypothetical protein